MNGRARHVGESSRVLPIGIIGGMGPEASLDLAGKVIRYFQRERGAALDSDFPEIILHSIPAPDILHSNDNEDALREMLTRSVLMLSENGCGVIAIACNTVQYLLDELSEHTSVPILSIAEVSAQHLKSRSLSKVAILSTAVTASQDVYGGALSAVGISYVYATLDQEEISEIIMRRLSGHDDPLDTAVLERIASGYSQRGYQAILLGCTELPLVLGERAQVEPFVDCTQLYAEAVAKAAIRGTE